jgi:hypothetical protein
MKENASKAKAPVLKKYLVYMASGDDLEIDANGFNVQNGDLAFSRDGFCCCTIAAGRWNYVNEIVKESSGATAPV